MKRWTMIFAGILGLTATAAVAQATVEDTDGDGAYSMEELLVAYPEMTQETFATVDENGDGSVDAEELAAAEAEGVLTAG